MSIESDNTGNIGDFYKHLKRMWLEARPEWLKNKWDSSSGKMRTELILNSSLSKRLDMLHANYKFK